MSRSEDPVIVRAELADLSAAERTIIDDMLVSLLIAMRRLASTDAGWLPLVRRNDGYFADHEPAIVFDRLGLIE